MSGIDTLIAIRSEAAEARILMLTTFEGDVEIQRALQAGARGYLLKSMPPGDLLAGIREVHAGKKRIPPEVAAARIRQARRRARRLIHENHCDRNAGRWSGGRRHLFHLCCHRREAHAGGRRLHREAAARQRQGVRHESGQAACPARRPT